MGIIKGVIENKNRLHKKIIKDALREANTIADVLLKRFGASEVILFGSLAEEEYFDEASDIDIAVKGLKDNYFRAYGYCLGLGKYNLDIKPYEDLSKKLKKNIDKRGKLLYGRRDS